MNEDQFATFRSALMRELDESRGAVMGELGKLGKKVDAIHHIASETAQRQFMREHDEDRYRRRTKAMEDEVARISALVDGPDWKRDPRDITGVHQLRELTEWRKATEAERRDSGIWWKRQRWVWTMAGIGALLGILITGCVSYAVVRVTTPALSGGK